MAALSILIVALVGTTNGAAVVTESVPLNFSMPQSSTSTTLHYRSGQSVNVSWTTPYNLTTVQVWQGPSENGDFAMDSVAANFTRNHTWALWNALPLNNDTANNNHFFFRLQKGDEPNTCSGCAINSPTFQIEGAESAPHTNASSSAPPPPDGTSMPSSSAPPSPSSISTSTKLAIGLGIGLGVSGAIVLLTLLWLWLNRQEKRMSAEDEATERGAAVLRREKEERQRYSSGNESARTQASSHPSFHFEDTPQEGFLSFWHRIFGR